MDKPVDYKKLWWRYHQHHKRYMRFVEAKKLVCQECGGAGGETDVILDDGTGPWESCGLCEGTGFVTPHMRGQWLRWKREDKLRATKSAKMSISL